MSGSENSSLLLRSPSKENADLSVNYDSDSSFDDEERPSSRKWNFANYRLVGKTHMFFEWSLGNLKQYRYVVIGPDW
jgi:hypothetical protein